MTSSTTHNAIAEHITNDDLIRGMFCRIETMQLKMKSIENSIEKIQQGINAIVSSDEVLTPLQVSAILNYDVCYLARMRATGKGPAFSQGERRGRVTYTRKAVMEWIEQNRRSSTSRKGGTRE